MKKYFCFTVLVFSLCLSIEAQNIYIDNFNEWFIPWANRISNIIGGRTSSLNETYDQTELNNNLYKYLFSRTLLKSDLSLSIEFVENIFITNDLIIDNVELLIKVDGYNYFYYTIPTLRTIQAILDKNARIIQAGQIRERLFRTTIIEGQFIWNMNSKILIIMEYEEHMWIWEGPSVIRIKISPL